MHFKTLVTVTMPTVEEDPHENAAVEQSIDLLQARKDDLAKDIMAELTLCTLMGRTTNFARQLVGASRRSYDAIQYRAAGRIQGIC